MEKAILHLMKGTVFQNINNFILAKELDQNEFNLPRGMCKVILWRICPFSIILYSVFSLFLWVCEETQVE